MLAADLQESSESDHTSETGTGEGSDLAGTGSGDLAGGASGRSGTRAGGVVTLTTVSGLTSRVNGDHGRVVALGGVAGLAGLASRAGDGVRVMFTGLDIQSNLPVVADNSGGGDDGLGDGARAVSDGQGSGLSDGVGLVAVNDLSGTGAVGGVSSNDLGGVGNVLGVGGNASSESESSSELHFDGWVLD